ncbi:J domain-containing protein [Paenibacillus agricola]|uniref:J domain-containing protein n=1 Tax=Paenibacillus agricola TaxID=2716264 RepID=A0ABX0IZ97_9BACL|nr:J domain-containing protein [Paenibacillus agricola]NHN29300.1 J domain-containing protein [Paenibacillus agricola]
MQNRREACGIIGLSEDASEQEIENRYFFLMKRYKYLEADERPSLDEPLFAAINEAYRFLIGYVPLQKVEFRELKWREKVQHIRDNYMMEIVYSLVLVLMIFAVGIGVSEVYMAFQAGAKDVGAYSPAEFPMAQHPGHK